MEAEGVLLEWLGFKDIDNGIITSALTSNSFRIVILKRTIWAITDTFINFLFDTGLSQTSILREKMGLQFSLPTACPILSPTCLLI